MIKYSSDDRWLITIDLDGTLLSNDSIHSDGENLISDRNIKSIKRCIEMGHKVVIVTGRPWRNTKKIYEMIKLHTIIGNYNGAFIHNPQDLGFSEIKSSMNRKFFKQMMDIPEFKKNVENFIIEFDDVTYMQNTKDNLMKTQFHINDEQDNLLKCDFDFVPHKNPFVLIFKIRHNDDDEMKYSLITLLRRRFGEALSFRYWTNTKKGTTCMEVNQKFISKSYAMHLIASYYNIPSSRTIAFGDGENDVEMLSTAELGVAMKNASNVVKSYARDVTDFNNFEDGVGKYLDGFFKEK